MGMIGNYFALGEAELTQILSGTLHLDHVEMDTHATLDIDKAWQAIQYLLCGEIDEGEPPMGYVVPMLMDHAIACDWDFGAFYLTPEQVAEAYAYLCTLSDDSIKSLYHFDAMVEDEVYPVMADEDAEQFYSYIHSNLIGIRAFYQDAYNQHNAIIFYVS